MSAWRVRVMLIAIVVSARGCGPPELALAPDHLVQSGGKLDLIGDLAGHGAVVVLVDGVPAHSAVLDGHRLRVLVPPLPRSGAVDVELVFADGTHHQLAGALIVSAPSLNVSD